MNCLVSREGSENRMGTIGAILTRKKNISSKQNAFFWASSFIVFSWVVNVLFLLLMDRSHYIDFLTFLVCLVFFISFVFSVLRKGFFSVYSLFLIALFVFNLGRLFCYLLGWFDFKSSAYGILTSFVWEEEITVVVLNAYLLFLSVFFVFLWRKRKESKRHDFPNRAKAFCFFRTLFLLALPLYAFFSFEQVSAIRSSGFMALYAAGSGADAGPILSILRFVFSVSFYMICCTCISKKRFVFYCFLFLSVEAIQLFAGFRAAFIISLLTILYLLTRVHGVRFRPSFIILVSAATILMVFMVAIARDGWHLNFSPLGAIKYFLIDMSNSINVPVFFLQNKSALSNNAYPYIMDPLVRLFMIMKYPFVAGGQSISVIGVRWSLAHQITYCMSPDYYLSGAGLGSNFIAELLEFGFPGVLIGSILLMVFISFFDNNISGRPFLLFMSIQIVGKILFEPRAEFFYDSYNFLKYAGVYFLIYFIFSFWIGEKKNHGLQRQRYLYVWH